MGRDAKVAGKSAEWSENNQLMARFEHLLEKEGGPEDGCVWEDME